jgi:hypothetical protein
VSFNLRPRNKAMPDFSFGAFGWSWLLEAGAGFPVGHFKGIEPASFLYLGRQDGRCLGYNDGAKVSASEAREMAKLTRWIVLYQRTLHHHFEQRSEEDRAHMLDNGQRLYNTPVRKDWLDHFERFADWAEKSGGFRVW